jgi:hypothetical protein
MEMKDVPEQGRISEMSGDIKFEELPRKNDEPKSVKSCELETQAESSEKVQDMGASLIKSTISLHSEEVQSVGPNVASIVSRGEKSRPSRRGRSQQRKDTQERKYTDKLHLQNPQKQSDTSVSLSVKAEVYDDVSSHEEVQSEHSATTKVTISEHAPVHKKHHHIVLKQPQETLKPQVHRGRSPSPMWNPGSTSYADILRGRQVSDGHEEALALTDLHDVSTSITEKTDVSDRKVQETYGDSYRYQQEDWKLPDSQKAVMSFQQAEEVYDSAADESPVQNVESYDMDQTSSIRDVVENVAPNDIVDSGTFLQEEVIPSVPEHDVSGVAVPPGMFEYIQQPSPDLVGFIASGQQLLNSGLGTYHTSAHQYVMNHDGDQSLVYPVTVSTTQQPDGQYETLSLNSNHYIQPSIESAAYTTPVHQGFVPQQYDLSQQAVLSDQDVTSSPEVTPVHNTRHSKKVRSGHHSQTNTAVADEEIKPVTIHQIESDHQTGSTDVQTEGDGCPLSYAQILAQGLCVKPLQPSSQAVNFSMKINDRSQSPQPTSPISSYSREWSASPSRDILPTVREEVTKSVIAADTTNIPKLENRVVKKKKDSKLKKEADGSTHVCSSLSADRQKHKCGKSKQKKKQTVSTSFEFNGKQEPVSENKEEDVPFVETEATAVASVGEPLTLAFSTKSVANNSLASVKVRKGGYKKSKLSDDGKQQNVDSKPVSQISPQNNDIMEAKENNAVQITVPDQLQIIDYKQGGITDQEKKKQQKKKKVVKHTDEDEIEKALKEIARMEMVFGKHKTKNIESTQESKIDVIKQEKEETKSKKTKTLADTGNANELIHEADPKQMAVVASSVETATVFEGTDSYENITMLQERQDKNPEIFHGAASKHGNENTEIPKVEQSKKKKKRAKKPVCNIYDTRQPVEEVSEMQNSSKGETINMECEIDIKSRQNVLFTQKLEPFAEKQLEVPEGTKLHETEPFHLEQEANEHLQDGNTRAVCKSGKTSQFDCIEVSSQESCLHPPDLLVDIKQEIDFLKTSEFVAGADSAVPVDADCKQKEVIKDEELKGTSSPLMSRRKRGNKKQKLYAKLPKEEVNKNDATPFMIAKSHAVVGSIPPEEEQTSQITSSHLAPVTIEDKTDDSQRDKVHEQVKNTNGSEVGAQSPIKWNKRRRGAKKGKIEQCEAPQGPKQQPAGSSLTSELDECGKRDDTTSDDISVKKSDVTDSSNKEALLSTELNIIQDSDASKIKRHTKKSRKDKQAKIDVKSKQVTEKQHSVEWKLEMNELEHNWKEVQKVSDKSAELLSATCKPLDNPAEDITSGSSLGLGITDTGVIKVVTSDPTMKGNSKKPKKSKLTAKKDIKEHSRGRENDNQDQAINIIFKGDESLAKTGGSDLELSSDKGKRSSKKSKKHKEAECEQNKFNVPAEDVTVDTNGSKGPEIVKDDTVVPPKVIATNTDSIHAFKQLEQTVTRSKKSNRKCKKLKLGGSEGVKDEHLLNHIPQDLLVIKSEKDMVLFDSKSEPEAQISESFEKQIPLISDGIEDQGTYECKKVVEETENVHAQTREAILHEEKADNEGCVKFEENKDVKYAFVPETSVLEHEMHENMNENLHEQNMEMFISTPAQQELTAVKDETFESERGETNHEFEPERKEVLGNTDENQNDDDTTIISALDQKDFLDKTNEMQEGEKQISLKETVFLDTLPKLKRRDTRKVRCAKNLQSDYQVNVPHKDDNETGYACSTMPLPCSSPKNKQVPGTPLVPHGTSQLPENQEDTFFTPQWITKSSVIHNLSSEDTVPFSQSVICDLPNASILDTSHVVQDTKQNLGDDSPLTPSSVSSPQSQVTLPVSSPSVHSDSEVTQESVEPQENMGLPGVESVGIFGSVKERTRKPRKIIDTMSVDEKTVKSIEIPSPSIQEKKRKPPKLPAKGDTKERDGKVKMAEEPNDLEEHEEYRVIKDKMRKKKKRPKIPTEFRDLQTKVENVAPDEAVKLEPLATEVDSFKLQDIMVSDFKIERNMESAYLQPLSPVNVIVEERAERETPFVIADSSLTNSEMKPVLLDAALLVRVPAEESGTAMKLSDIESTETSLDLKVVQLADIPQEVVKHHSSCVIKSDEFSDAWMNALDEPLVFSGCDEEEDGNTFVPSPSGRNFETDDALTKIQEAVIAAVESVCDVLSESDLKAGTVTTATNDRHSEPVLKTETVAAVHSDVLSESDLKTETVLIAANDMLPECGLKTETAPVLASDVLPEHGLNTETLAIAEDDVLPELELKTETVTEVANNVLPEHCLNTETVPTVVDDMLPEHGLKNETITAVAINVLSEPSVKMETITTAVNDVLCEPEQKTETIITVVSDPGLKTEADTTVENDDVLSEASMKTEAIITAASDVFSDRCLKTEAITTVADDLSDPGLKNGAVTTFENDDLLFDPCVKTKTITTAANEDTPSEPGMMTETVTTVVNDTVSEPDLKTETVITVANDVLFETGLKTGTISIAVNDLFPEPGLRTETMTAVKNDVQFEPGLETETTAAVVDVKPLVQASEALIDNSDATSEFVISPFSEEQNAEKKSIMLTTDTETKVSGTVLQKPSLHNEEGFGNLDIPSTELTPVCQNPFIAELIVQEVKPCYYVCKDAEMYWQEKVAQELKKISLTIPKSKENQGLKHSCEKPVERKEELHLSVAEQPKFQALLDESPRSGHVFEVPTYDTQILHDAERRWHEMNTSGLLRGKEIALENPESTFFYVENEVTQFTKEHSVEIQVINPDSPINDVKESTLPEILTYISIKSGEEPESFGSNSIISDSKPHMPSSENVTEVTGIFEEQFTSAPSETLGLQGSSTLVKDRDKQQNVQDRDESQLKAAEDTEVSIGPEKESHEPLVNLCKENVWLESYKFLDAERKWREFNSEVLPKEFVCEEESREIGAVDVVKSQESVRDGEISSTKLPHRQQLEVMDHKMEISDAVILQESTDIISPLQDASQEPGLKLVSELPTDLTDDMLPSQIASENQVLGSKLAKESTDSIPQSQVPPPEPELKSLSELPTDLTSDIPPSQIASEDQVLGSKLAKESTDSISQSQVPPPEPELKSISDLRADLTDDILPSLVVSKDQVLSSELAKESTDSISESQVSPSQSELKSGSELTKESVGSIFQSQIALREPELKSSFDLTKDEIQFIFYQGESYCNYDVIGIHDAEKQYQEQMAFCKQTTIGNLSDVMPKEASRLEYVHSKQNKTRNEARPRGHSIESSYRDYDMFGLHDAERQFQEQLAVTKSTEIKTDTLTDITPVVANNMGTFNGEVQNCEKEEEILLQTESMSGTMKTWATVVASKMPDSIQGPNCEEKSLDSVVVNKGLVNTLSELQDPSQPSVHIHVEIEKEDSNVSLVEVDPEGFTKVVSKREMKKRKSRSRSRSRCKDGVAPKKPQEGAVTVTDVEVKETDLKIEENYSVNKHAVGSVTSESSKRFSVPLAVDAKCKETGGDVELHTAGEDKSSSFMTQLKHGKEVQKAGRKSKGDKDENEKKRQQRSGKSSAQKVPQEGKRKKPSPDSEQEVESVVRLSVREVLNHNLPLDGAFWPGKWQCHDAECQWQETIAQSKKKPVSTTASSEVKSDKTHDRKDDSDGGNSGHSSPGPHAPKGGGGDGGGLGPSGVTTEQLSADLPGGICSWPDESTYLAGPDILVVFPNGLNANEDEALEAEEEHTSRLAHRVAEEVFTDLDDEQDSKFLFYPSSCTTREVQPSCRKDDSTAVFVVQMKVGDFRNPLFSLCFCCVFLRA